MTAEIYLARHGETNYNLEGRIQGHIDQESELTQRGIEQSEALGIMLRDLGMPFDWIYSSNLRRARQTTQIISRHLGNITIEYTPDLRERGMGSLEGRRISDLGVGWEEDRRVYPLDQGEEFLPNDSEPFKSIDERARRMVQEFLNPKDSRILVVSHGWFNRYMINLLLEEERLLHSQGNGVIHYVRLDASAKVEECKLNAIQL